jgi:hypothetical protein
MSSKRKTRSSLSATPPPPPATTDNAAQLGIEGQGAMLVRTCVEFGPDRGTNQSQKYDTIENQTMYSQDYIFCRFIGIFF